MISAMSSARSSTGSAPLIWETEIEGVPVRLLVDTGATGLEGDGLLKRASAARIALGWEEGGQALRLPDGSVKVATKIKYLDGEKGVISMAACDLFNEEGIDGLVAKSGVARMEQEIGLTIKWADNSITFEGGAVRAVEGTTEQHETWFKKATERLVNEFPDVFLEELPKGVPPRRNTDLRMIRRKEFTVS